MAERANRRHFEFKRVRMMPRLFIAPDGPLSGNAEGKSCPSSIFALSHPKTGISSQKEMLIQVFLRDIW